ncbi:lipoprotein [Streptomyces cyaneogriseus subsp. noncyanogenus]|uniref:Lipoprotein n=1 Tax=Streptomyces cyaneogriseus subsp. noncyanogenus TaxID=477245 RepID=A0A0C5FTT5_9ACTN|nr:hypothetical protein [Streptomyces cyaneogriseus]AJP03452.1 lipoprotein [Streptomyces cyaneogriseus subsp. noncyanogenus]
MESARRRLRSSTVVLGGMGVLAAALAACGSEPDRRCVDRDSHTLDGYKVIADKNCKSGTSSGARGKSRKKSSGTGAGARADAAWYYDADVSRGYAEGGTFSRDEAVDRGGFGCSGSGSGGG